MYSSLLLFTSAILSLHSTQQEIDLKNCWLLTKAVDNGTPVLFKSDCVPFIDPNGTVGCYNYYDNEVFVTGTWKKQNDTKLKITRSGEVSKYIIYQWSEKEIVIGLESKPTEREYFTRK